MMVVPVITFTGTNINASLMTSNQQQALPSLELLHMLYTMSAISAVPWSHKTNDTILINLFYTIIKIDAKTLFLM